MGLFNKNKQGGFNLFRDADNTGNNNQDNYYNQNNNAYNNSYDNSSNNNSLFGSLFGRGSRNSVNSSLVILLLIVIVFMIFGQGNPNCTGSIVSSIKRTKLETEFNEENGFHIDVPESWTDETLKLNMLYFLQNTGVAPALYIISDDASPADTADAADAEKTESSAYTREQLSDIAENYYKEHFSDELHFLTVFVPYEDDYVSAYYVGEEAKAIMDEEALAIFESTLNESFFNRYTKDNLVFPNTYLSATNSVMSIFQESPPVVKVLVIVVAVALIAFLFYRQSKRVKKDMQAEAQEDQQDQQ